MRALADVAGIAVPTEDIDPLLAALRNNLEAAQTLAAVPLADDEPLSLSTPTGHEHDTELTLAEAGDQCRSRSVSARNCSTGPVLIEQTEPFVHAYAGLMTETARHECPGRPRTQRREAEVGRFMASR